MKKIKVKSEENILYANVLEKGMEEMSKEFKEKGNEIYNKL